MASATETLTNGQAAAAHATKAAAETVAKATTRATTKATQSAVDNATSAYDSATKAVKSAQENTADVTAATTAAVTKAANTTVEALTEATEATVASAAETFDVAAKAVQAVGLVSDPRAAQGKAQEFIDAFSTQSRKGALVWLDAYVKSFDAYLDLNTTIASATKVEAVSDLVAAGVDAMQQLNTVYVGTLRDLLK